MTAGAEKLRTMARSLAVLWRSGNERFTATVMVVALAAVVAGCGSSGGGSASSSGSSSGGSSSKEPTKLGFIADETGSLAPLGTSYKRGLDTAVKIWNQDPGHRQVAVQACDSQSTGPGALSCYQRLKDSVNVLSGPHLFLGFAAVKGIAGSGSVPLITATPVAAPTADGQIFQSVPTLVDGAQAGLTYLKKRGLTRIAVLTSNDQSGNVSNQATKKFAASMGMTIVANEVFDPASQSLAPQAGKIAAAHPQAVMASTAGPQLITALRDLKSAGVTVPLMLNYASMSVPLLTQAGAAAGDNLYFYGTSAFVPSSIHDVAYKARVKQFSQEYQKTYNAEPDLVAFVGADTAMIAAEAANPAPDKVKATLQSGTSLPGVLFPTFQFSKDQHVGVTGQDVFAILRWQPSKHGWTVAD